MLFLFLAQTPAPSPSAPGGGLLSMLPFLFLIVIMYYVMIRPQMRRQKEQAKLVSALKTGDKVVTSGGVRGTIVAIKEDYLHLRVPPDNLRLEVSRASILSVTTEEPSK